MRPILAGLALLLLGSGIAQAQSYYDDRPPPPRPRYDDDPPPPPPPPRFGRYDDDDLPPPPPPRRRCRTLYDDDGQPYRVCRRFGWRDY